MATATTIALVCAALAGALSTGCTKCDTLKSQSSKCCAAQADARTATCEAQATTPDALSACMNAVDSFEEACLASASAIVAQGDDNACQQAIDSYATIPECQAASSTTTTSN